MSIVSDGGTIFTTPFNSGNATILAFSFFCWVKYPTTVTGGQGLFLAANSTNTTGANADFVGLFKTGASNLNTAFYNDDAAHFLDAGESLSPQANTWVPLCGVMASTISTRLVTPRINAVNTLSSGSVGVATWDTLQFLGRKTLNTAAANFLNSGGMLAECAFWNTALSTADINNLVFEGYNPGIVRRDRLICYLPLRINAQDYGPLHLPFASAGSQGTTFFGDHPIIDQWNIPTKSFLFNVASLTNNGTLTQTQGAYTISATGGPVSGLTLTSTQGASTISSVGGPVVSGALTSTQGAFTISSVGQLLLQGSLALTMGANTLSATGGAAVVGGTLVATLGNDALSSVGGPISGLALTATQGAYTISSLGVLPLSGALTVTQGASTIASAGQVALRGDLTATTGASTISSLGRVSIGGNLNSTSGFFAITATSAIVVGGALTATLDTDAVASTALVTVGGALSSTQGAFTIAGAGTVQSVRTGALTLTQGANTLTGAGNATHSEARLDGCGLLGPGGIN